MIYEGRSAHGPVPPSRWNAEAFHSPDPFAPESIPWKEAHFIAHDIAAFDARFFGIPPSEAASMDPQQRMLLEVTYEALENAGVPLQSLRGSATGVFVAEFCRDYDKIMGKDIAGAHKWTILGTGDALMSNRISYIMDLKGPSMTLDTGCVSAFENRPGSTRGQVLTLEEISPAAWLRFTKPARACGRGSQTSRWQGAHN